MVEQIKIGNGDSSDDVDNDPCANNDGKNNGVVVVYPL